MLQPRNQHRAARLCLIGGLACAIPIATTHTSAQARQLQPIGNQNPVYIADSPIASDALKRAAELIDQDNLDEAVRLCDEIIRTHGERLIRVDDEDPDALHIPVRERVHRFMLANPELLETYRRQMTPRAQIWLDRPDEWLRAAREAWLTEPGLIASLRYAQTQIESGRFHAGRALLDQAEQHPDAGAFTQRAQELRTFADRFVDATPPNIEQEDHAHSLVWRGGAQDAVSLEGIVPGVLAQVPLTPNTQLELGDQSTPSRLSGASWKPTAWSAPLVEDQFLFINDGYTISCFDRFTLRPNWRIQTFDQSEEIPLHRDARARLGRLLDDATSVSSDGQRSIYVSAGAPRNSQDRTQSRVLKLDQETGSVRWSVDIESLDPALAGASIRGPIVVDRGTVVVTARANNRRQRLISLSVLALDAATGELLWTQPLASAGSLPFQQMGQLAHTPIVRDGVIYYTDLIGFAAAIRIATGDVLWARTMPAPDLYARSTRPAFAGNAPVINRHGLFILTSNGSEIFQLDPETGRTIASRPADLLGESYYLLSVSEDLFVCVSEDRISAYQAGSFATTSSKRSPQLGDENQNEIGIRGRVIAAGDRLIAPVELGVRVLDPAAPSESVFIPLDATGNIAALDGQIIVVDQMNASSFLAWGTASELLEKRIASDPSAAITIAELAHRSERYDEIVPSVQRAMSVVASLPIDQRTPQRDKLFEVVVSIIRAPATGEQDASLYERLGEERVLELMRALGELARTHHQTVAHRMQLGALHERYSRFDEAIIAYQDVLDQPTLRSAMWEGNDIAVRAGLEAARRIGKIIAQQGFGAYDSANQRAVAELQYLGNDAEPGQYEALAQRYPWSRTTPELLLSASRGYQNAGRLPASIEAARSGIESIDRLNHLGLTTPAATLELLAERLISGLIASNRARDAHSAARALLDAHPDITIRRNGSPITLEQLAQAAGNADTLPILGRRFVDDPDPVLVTGSPLRPAHRLDPGGILVYAPQLAQLRYLRAGRNVFETFWERTAPGTQPPTIVWQGPARTLIFWPESVGAGDAGTLECVDTSTGTLAWSIEDIRIELEQGSARVADDTARMDTLITIPAQGTQPIQQLLVACDGQSVVVTDRIGRALGVDLYTGELLWQRDLPVNRVHDLDLAHGQLGVCGLVIIDRAQDQRHGSITPLAASIDPRTGEPGQVTERFGHQPRWVRIGDRSRLFVASSQRITAIDTERGIVEWVVNSEDIADSQDAWVADAHLLVLSDRGTLWALDPEDGSRENRPIDTRDRIVARGWIRIISEIGRTNLLSSRGIVSFDQDAQAEGVDARSGGTELIDIAWGREHAITLSEASINENRLECTLSLVDHTNASQLDSTRLSIPAVLGRRPTEIVPVNGGALIGFGEVSIFVRTLD